MNQVPEIKFIETLFKRLQELSKENQDLKSRLTNKNSQIENNNSHYLANKELIIENREGEQICSFCNYELNSYKFINSLKLYFCSKGNCSLIMEKIIDDVIYQFRNKEKN